MANSVEKALLFFALGCWLGCNGVSGNGAASSVSGALSSDAVNPAPSGQAKRGDGSERSARAQVEGLTGLKHKPIAILTERNPWAMVVGSDVPTVALYEDGTAIYQKTVGDRPQAFIGKSVEKISALLSSLATQAFEELPTRFSVVKATDQPTVNILLRRGDTWQSASGYGLSRSGASSIASIPGSPAPEAFVKAYQALLAFELPDAKVWEPEQIEVMFWDFSYAKQPAEPWPESIPAPGADFKLPPKGSGVYKHFIPGKYEPALKVYLKSLTGNKPAGLNGYKLAISYRRNIPEESYVQAVNKCLWHIEAKRPPGELAGCFDIP